MFESKEPSIRRRRDPPDPVWVRTFYDGQEVGLPGWLHEWVGLVDWGSRVWRAKVSVDPADVPEGVMPPRDKVPASWVLPRDPDQDTSGWARIER